jgi:hypothetical protein
MPVRPELVEGLSLEPNTGFDRLSPNGAASGMAKAPRVSQVGMATNKDY